MGKLNIFFARVVKYDMIKHFAVFGNVLYVFFYLKKGKTRFFIQKWLVVMLLMTSYLVTIATDFLQTSQKCVSRIN